MCKFPLVGYWTVDGLKVTSKFKFNERFGKIDYSFVGSEMVLRRQHFFSKDYELFIHPYTGELMRPMQIPCGQCIECRLARSREWADRMEMEKEFWADDWCYFLTLTYDNDHLPTDHRFPTVPSLEPDDVRLFMDRLRSYFRDNFKFTGMRFYLCGEYGTKTHRPHYHIIAFNCPVYLFKDIVHLFNNFQGDPFYISKRLDDIWGKGFVCFSNVTWDTCCYTARYVTKKLYKSDLTDIDGTDYELPYLPEFSRASNRPGIGAPYWASHADKIIENRGIQLKSGRFVPIPRYFKKLLKASDEETFYRLQSESLDYANLRYDQLISQCPHAEEPSYLLAVEHDMKKNVYSKLIRSLDI